MNEKVLVGVCKTENCYNTAIAYWWCYSCACKIGDGQSTYKPPRGVKNE